MLTMFPTLLFFVSLGCWYAALPPLGWWPLAVVAPILWTVLVRDPRFLRRRRDALGVFGATFLFWVANVYWIGYPHPATIFGLVVGAAYLAIYLPIFFVVARRGVRRFHLPPLVALPIVWCGLEWLRYRLFGGFSFGGLPQAFTPVPLLVQTADIAGEHGVSFLIVAFGAGIGSAIPLASASRLRAWKNRNTLWPLATSLGIAASIAIFVVLYGAARMNQYDAALAASPIPHRTIAVIQGNFPCVLVNPGDLYERTFEALTDEACAAARDGAELVILPETVCLIPLIACDAGYVPREWQSDEQEEGETPDEVQTRLDAIVARSNDELLAWASAIGVPVLTGISAYTFTPEHGDTPRRANAAVLIEPQRRRIGRYDKRHLVMFGEYIPLAAWMPTPLRSVLQSLCPTAEPGQHFVAMTLAATSTTAPLVLAVNICYESTVPHFIRQQVSTLRDSGNDATLLVNLSNDGWFLGSVQQDFHLATHILRAIEHRKEYATATNGGFSAILDATGRLRAIGVRGTTCRVAASVPTQSVLTSFYTDWGDTLAIACFLTTLGIGLVRRRSFNTERKTP